MSDCREYHLEEREYIMPPHPEAVIASEERTPPLEPPTTAENTLTDLIKQAVGELLSEVMVELRNEMQKEIRGGIESYAKNQELSVGGRA